MIPMEPAPEDFAKQLQEKRTEMEQARLIAYYAHSRRGLLRGFLHRLADRVDPTGRARQGMR